MNPRPTTWAMSLALMVGSLAATQPADARPSSGSGAAERRRPPAANKHGEGSPRPGPQGKQEFLRQRCNDCHTVRSQHVVRSPRRSGRSTDLSSVGRKRRPWWLRSYLLGQTRKHGKTHTARFKGNRLQLDRLCKWLGALR